MNNNWSQIKESKDRQMVSTLNGHRPLTVEDREDCTS